MRTNLTIHLDGQEEIEHSTTEDSGMEKLWIAHPLEPGFAFIYYTPEAREKLLRALLSPSEYRALRQAREEAA